MIFTTIYRDYFYFQLLVVDDISFTCTLSHSLNSKNRTVIRTPLSKMHVPIRCWQFEHRTNRFGEISMFWHLSIFTKRKCCLPETVLLAMDAWSNNSRLQLLNSYAIFALVIFFGRRNFVYMLQVISHK